MKIFLKRKVLEILIFNFFIGKNKPRDKAQSRYYNLKAKKKRDGGLSKKNQQKFKTAKEEWDRIKLERKKNRKNNKKKDKKHDKLA